MLRQVYSLGWEGSKGEGLGVKKYCVLSQRGLFKVPLPYPTKASDKETEIKLPGLNMPPWKRADHRQVRRGVDAETLTATPSRNCKA